MRVLVTGGSGAIGSFVARELVDEGHDVTVLDVAETDVESVTYVQGDVTDTETVDTAVSDADAVVHLAALLPDACRQNPSRANSVNVGGTLTVLDAAAAEGARAVIASSKAVFGTPPPDHLHPVYEPIGEDGPTSPTDIYGVTKLACEQYAKRYRADGLDVAALRFADTYGPGKGQEHGILAFVPDIIRRAQAGERIHLEGGDQRNDFVYYRDVARGVARAVETDELNHTTYHIGSDEVASVRELAEVLRTETDATIDVSGGLDYLDLDHPTYYPLDISRARADLGYEPTYPLEAGVRDFLETLRSG